MPIIALLVFLLFGPIAFAAPIVAASGGEGVTDDIFDGSQLTMVLANSPLLACCGGAPAEDTFGGAGGVESFHTLFSDGPPVGSIDFINFQTANLIELTGYNALPQTTVITLRIPEIPIAARAVSLSLLPRTILSPRSHSFRRRSFQRLIRQTSGPTRSKSATLSHRSGRSSFASKSRERRAVAPAFANSTGSGRSCRSQERLLF